MSSLSERLQQAMEKRGLTSQAELARACKVKTSSVSAWFSGKTKSLKGTTARLAAEYFGCDRDWLAFGIGQPHWRGEYGVAEHAATYSQPPSLATALDVLGRALAAVPAERRDEIGDALRQWAKYGGRATYQQTVTELLGETSGKRQRAA